MLESEWMRSQRLGRGTSPAVRTPFLSRAAIERPLETQGFLSAHPHPSSLNALAGAFIPDCVSESWQPRAFFRLADPAEIIE
jgi:hypothetical protein